MDVDDLPDLTNKLHAFFNSRPLKHLEDDATEKPAPVMALNDLRRLFSAFLAIYENLETDG